MVLILLRFGVLAWLASILIAAYVGWRLTTHGGLFEARLVVSACFGLGSLIGLAGTLRGAGPRFLLTHPQPGLLIHNVILLFAIFLMSIVFFLIALSGALEGDVTPLVGVFYAVLTATSWVVLSGGVLLFAGERFWAGLYYVLPFRARPPGRTRSGRSRRPGGR